MLTINNCTWAFDKYIDKYIEINLRFYFGYFTVFSIFFYETDSHLCIFATPRVTIHSSPLFKMRRVTRLHTWLAKMISLMKYSISILLSFQWLFGWKGEGLGVQKRGIDIWDRGFFVGLAPLLPATSDVSAHLFHVPYCTFTWRCRFYCSTAKEEILNTPQGLCFGQFCV